MAITDDFNRSGDLGAGWDEVEGADWETNGSIAHYTNASGTFHTARRSESAFPDDHYAEVECEFTTAGGKSCPAVRMDGTGSCYLAELAATGVEVRRHTGGGGYVLVDAVGGLTHVIDTFHLVRLTVTGTTITVHVDGVLRLTTADATLTAGKPGILALFDGARFDDFESTDASGGPPSVHGWRGNYPTVIATNRRR